MVALCDLGPVCKLPIGYLAPEEELIRQTITAWKRVCGLGGLVFWAILAASPQIVVAQDVPLTRIAQIYGVSANPFGEEILYLATERGFFAVGPDGLAQLLSSGINKFTGFAADPGRAGRFIAAGDATGGDEMDGDAMDKGVV